VELHLYDPAELVENQPYAENGRKLLVRRFAQMYVGDGKEFDLVIDDIFEPDKGTSNIMWKSRFWVAKIQKQGEFDHIVNSCFHKTEARAFSHSIESKLAKYTSCVCAFCNIVDRFARSEDEYIKLRGRMHAVLKTKHCPDYPQFHDLGLASSMLQKIALGQVVPVVTNAEMRVIESISMMHKVVEVEKGHCRSSENKSLKVVNVSLPYPKICLGEYIAYESYPYFTNKCVKFFWCESIGSWEHHHY